MCTNFGPIGKPSQKLPLERIPQTYYILIYHTQALT
jgi:hypothetical protein